MKQAPLFAYSVSDLCDAIRSLLRDVDFESRVHAINELRESIHKESPFSGEPVDFVRWVKAESVHANDYNPNSVAPPEMELLRTSISADGYTQPIVAMLDGEQTHEVIDGFHRHRVGKECVDIQKRIHGYLPIVQIRADRQEKSDRMAATIRHNRARGKHRVEAMSDIVVELKRRNWSEDKICRELGMDRDEVLRLCQITGLAELFADQEFSRAWDVEGEITESDFRELTDDADSFDEGITSARTVNTSDPERIFHTHDLWECHKAGFYASSKPGMTKVQCEEAYAKFLSDIDRFKDAMGHVINEWKHSCEHYLTNTAMNRIAYMGQAAACYSEGLPSAFRSGYSLLNEQQQKDADEAALEYINSWLVNNGRSAITMDEAYSGDRQSDIY